jgi:deoxyribonuclease V
MSRAPLRLDGELVGYRVRTRKGATPVVAHAAWRTAPEVAAEIALGATTLARWPDPLREARRLARALRERDAPRRR